MYFKNIAWILLIILGSCDFGSVKGLQPRHTTKPPWTKSTALTPTLRSAHNPQQYPPIYHYPFLPQRPPHQYPRPPGKPPQHTTPSPQDIPSSTIADQFDKRYSDGSYEYRYALPDGTVRYERGYFVYIQQKKILVVKGYYSYRLTNRRYLTVFYTADQYGYRQDSSSFTWHRPILPSSLGTTAVSSWDDYRSS